MVFVHRQHHDSQAQQQQRKSMPRVYAFVYACGDGRSPGEVAKAFTITRETFDARELWAQIDALDGKVPESVQIDALQVIWSLQRSMTRTPMSRAAATSLRKCGLSSGAPPVMSSVAIRRRSRKASTTSATSAAIYSVRLGPALT